MSSQRESHVHSYTGLNAALRTLLDIQVTQAPSFLSWSGMGLLVSLLHERNLIWTAGSGEYLDAVASAVVHKPGERVWHNPANWSVADEAPAALALAAYRALAGRPWKGETHESASA